MRGAGVSGKANVNGNGSLLSRDWLSQERQVERERAAKMLGSWGLLAMWAAREGEVRLCAGLAAPFRLLLGVTCHRLSTVSFVMVFGINFSC